MADYPDSLKYTKEHEWTRIAGNKATIGITGFAKDQLGDVVYLELPEAGAQIVRGEPFGTCAATWRSWDTRWSRRASRRRAPGRWSCGGATTRTGAPPEPRRTSLGGLRRGGDRRSAARLGPLRVRATRSRRIPARHRA